MNNFGLAGWSSRTGRLNLIPLLILLAGSAACFCIAEIRRHPGYRLILLWTAVAVCSLTWLDGLKPRFYLILLTPLHSVLCAIVMHWVWAWRPRWRKAAAAT